MRVPRRRPRDVEAGPLPPALVDWFVGDERAFQRRSDADQVDVLIRTDREHEQLAAENLSWLILECDRRKLPRPCLAEQWAKWHRPGKNV